MIWVNHHEKTLNNHEKRIKLASSCAIIGEIPDTIIISRLQEGGCAYIRRCACIRINTVLDSSCLCGPTWSCTWIVFYCNMSTCNYWQLCNIFFLVYYKVNMGPIYLLELNVHGHEGGLKHHHPCIFLKALL